MNFRRKRFFSFFSNFSFLFFRFPLNFFFFFINNNIQDDSEIVFKIKKSTPLKKLMSAYCQRNSLDQSQIVFLYEGQRIVAENTPDALGMEDGDEIDAMIHQIGGGN